MNDLRDDEQDLQAAFAATSAELDPAARERLLGYADDLSDQATLQADFDQSAEKLDELTQRRLLGFAERLAANHAPKVGARSPRLALSRRAFAGLLAVAAALALLIGARWWPQQLSPSGAPQPDTALLAPPQAAKGEPLPNGSAEDAWASVLPDFSAESASDQVDWPLPPASSDELEMTDLASQFDSLHGMEPSELDGEVGELL